jgi:phosphate transport system substrate-binding protein
MLADTKNPDAAKGKAVKELATYILSTKCAKDAGGDLGFSVLDGSFLKKAQDLIARIG